MEAQLHAHGLFKWAWWGAFWGPQLLSAGLAFGPAAAELKRAEQGASQPSV